MLCDWHIPEAHPFEYWSDGRAYDGTVTIQQPLIAPLFGGISPHEFLSAFTSAPFAQQLCRGSRLLENATPRRGLRRLVGAIRSRWPDCRLRAARQNSYAKARLRFRLRPPPLASNANDLDVIFRPDPYIADGRTANNAWLQELPRPFTKLTWDNAVLLAPATAEKLKLASQQTGGTAPQRQDGSRFCLSEPGTSRAGSVALHLGFGHTRLGRAANGAGFNAYRLRGSGAPWADSGLTMHPTEDTFPLASTQMHHTMEGRPIILTATLAEFEANPKVRERSHGERRSPDALQALRLHRLCVGHDDRPNRVRELQRVRGGLPG